MRLSGAGSGGCTWRCGDGERDDECSGLERGLCNVRAAFVADAAPESAALAGPVIARWYYGPRQ